MPRQLPWKVQMNPGTPNSKHRSTPAGSASRSPAPSSSHTSADTRRPTPKPKSETPRRSLGRLSNAARSPSTSPPPEPIQEEFMREGVDKDDRYRMVEDEFLAVAHDFTRHIHAAEYQRLKGLARSQNEETIQNISRPVTGGEMTDIVKRRQAALDIVARQSRALGKKRIAAIDSDSDEGGDENGSNSSSSSSSSRRRRRRRRRRSGGSSLQGLMDSPRKKAVPLTSFSSNLGAGGSPTSRRMTDRNQDIRTHGRRVTAESTSDDDDLDGGPAADWLPKRTGKPEVENRATNSAPSNSSRLATFTPGQPRALLSKDSTPKSTTHQVGQTTTAHRPANPSSTSGGSKTVEIKQEENDDGDDDFFSRIRSRRAEMRRRSGGIKSESTPDRDKDRDAFSLDDIPSFL